MSAPATAPVPPLRAPSTSPHVMSTATRRGRGPAKSPRSGTRRVLVVAVKGFCLCRKAQAALPFRCQSRTVLRSSWSVGSHLQHHESRN